MSCNITPTLLEERKIEVDNHLASLLLGVIFLSPMLGWISFLGVLTAAVTELIRRKGTQKQNITKLALMVSGAFLMVMLSSNWLHPSHSQWWPDLRFVFPLIAPFLIVGLFQQAQITPLTIRKWAILTIWCTTVFTTLEFVYFTHYLGVVGYRARALSANPLFVSAMLVPMLFLAWIDIDRQSPKQLWLSLFTYAAGLFCLGAVLGARMSVLIVMALSPGLVWYALRRVPTWRQRAIPLLTLLLLAIVGMGALLAWISPSFIVRFGQILEFLLHPDLEKFSDESIRLRAVHWVAGWQAFMDKPWSGYGFENERLALALHQMPGVQILSTAHQQYLTFAIGAGVSGLLFGLLYLCLPWIAVCQKQRTAQRIYAASALALPIMLNGLTDTFFDDIRLLSYYTVMSVLLASVRYPEEPLNAPLPQTSHPA